MADGRAGIEVQRGEAAEDGRVVVLDAGRDAEEARFEVADEEDELLPFHRRAGQLGERADERDGERGRAAQAGAARRVRARSEAHTSRPIWSRTRKMSCSPPTGAPASSESARTSVMASADEPPRPEPRGASVRDRKHTRLVRSGRGRGR